jgi:dTDP-4-amino-4,6-dideoxygalactose transaminase
MIPPVKVNITNKENILKDIQTVLDSGMLTQNKFNKEFEEKFSDYTKSKYAIAVSSGTSAIEIIIRSLRINSSKIIVPTNTFAATTLAVLHSGNQPVFIDCDNTLNLDPNLLESLIDNNTKALILVHIGGFIHPQIDKIIDICKKKNIYLIEDAAHAHGSIINNKFAGTFGDAGAFSFFPTKVITSGEGGMITTNNKLIYTKSLTLRDQGKKSKNENICVDQGYNWRMSELHAIIGLSQLKEIENFINERRKIAHKFDKNLNNKITTIKPIKNSRPNYYKYCIFGNWDRDKIKNVLREKYKISCPGEIYSQPLHRQPLFKKYSNQNTYPISEKLCSNMICLPIYPGLSNNKVEYIIESINKLV